MNSKDTFFSKKRTINFRGNIFDLSQPKVMGILNITPDSFYSRSRISGSEELIRTCEMMLEQGVDMIDIGAYSSRPGAENISGEEELSRLEPSLSEIRKRFPEVIISIDTFRSEVAEIMLKNYDVQIINDISAGEADELMFETVARHQAVYVMMHMKGNPQNMQLHTEYPSMVKDIIRYLSVRIEKAQQAGIMDIILDPGFGFGKSMEQNYELLKRLDEFKIFELPLLVGMSRKSMIYKLLNIEPEEALTGTIVANAMALNLGADILRVHDVKEARETIKIVQAFKNAYI